MSPERDKSIYPNLLILLNNLYLQTIKLVKNKNQKFAICFIFERQNPKSFSHIIIESKQKKKTNPNIVDHPPQQQTTQPSSNIMTESLIDFTQSSRKLHVNPIVPLSLLDIFCRTNDRAQATLLGKVYANHVEVLDVLPVSADALRFDYPEHSKRLQTLQTIYPGLEVLGAGITDLNTTNLDIPTLHTVYANKDSGFRTQNLVNPIILSVGTDLKDGNFRIQAYSFNNEFKFCYELLGISSFEKWTVKLSFGDAKVEELAPIFTGLRDQEAFLPRDNVRDLVSNLLNNLRILSKHVDRIIKKDEVSDNQLGLALKQILSFSALSKSEIEKTAKSNSSDSKLAVYLSSIINTHNMLSNKIAKLA